MKIDLMIAKYMTELCILYYIYTITYAYSYIMTEGSCIPSRPPDYGTNALQTELMTQEHS